MLSFKHMMYGYNYGGMMGGAGTFGAITWLIVIVDLVLAGIWLWKQIKKQQFLLSLESTQLIVGINFVCMKKGKTKLSKDEFKRNLHLTTPPRMEGVVKNKMMNPVRKKKKSNVRKTHKS